MRTILFPEGNIPDPFIINTRDGDYTLYVLSAVLIVFFWCIILWHYTSAPLSSVFGQCDPGDCPTNRITGQKRCPTSTDIELLYDLENEVCNPPTSCTSSFTPYAINSDNSFNVNGICENDTICRCSANVTCPYFAEVKFTRQSSSGKLFASDYYYTQSIINSANTALDKSLENSFDNVLSQSCFIDPSDIGRANASLCTSLITDIDVDICIQSNPCLSGRLTFVPEKNKIFDTAIDVYTTPMACIAGQTCLSGTVPVFDWSDGTTKCYTLKVL
jgi:hypothetical protein